MQPESSPLPSPAGSGPPDSSTSPGSAVESSAGGTTASGARRRPRRPRKAAARKKEAAPTVAAPKGAPAAAPAKPRRRRPAKGAAKPPAAAPPAAKPAPAAPAPVQRPPAPATTPVTAPAATSSPPPAGRPEAHRRGRRGRGRGRGRGGAAPAHPPASSSPTPSLLRSPAPSPPPAGFPLPSPVPPALPAPPGAIRGQTHGHHEAAVPGEETAPADSPKRVEREFIPADRLRACQDAIGYHFRDIEYLRHALTHSSVKTENHPSNERLEFLGDSVLGHVVAEYVYHLLPDYDEGEMTKVKSVVVSTQGLAAVAQKVRLDKYLIVGRGISMRGIIPQSLMANVFEAVIAAVYLDRGFESARLYILDHLGPPIDECLQDRHQKNYKSILQQIAQRDLNSTPIYKVRREDGPDHRKDFEVVAVVGGYEFEPGWGPTKKEAEQRAARAAVMALTQRLNPRGKDGG